MPYTLGDVITTAPPAAHGNPLPHLLADLALAGLIEATPAPSPDPLPRWRITSAGAACLHDWDRVADDIE